MWPCCCTEEQLARQTPRQTFDLWNALQELSKSMKAPSASGEPAQTDSPPSEEGERPVGVQGYRGLNMEGHDCWKPYPGECDWDPFSVPEEIVFERHQAFGLERCKEGALGHVGVPQGNYAAARDFIDQTWKANRKEFRELESAFVVGGEQGHAKILALCNAGKLAQYCVQKGDVKLADEWWKAVNGQHADKFQALREKRNGIPDNAARQP